MLKPYCWRLESSKVIATPGGLGTASVIRGGMGLPFKAVAKIGTVTLPPAAIDGMLKSLNAMSGCVTTVRVTGQVRVRFPLVPVIVMMEVGAAVGVLI